MKRSIPEGMITAELVNRIYKKNDPHVIRQSLSPETLKFMRRVWCPVKSVSDDVIALRESGNQEFVYHHKVIENIELFLTDQGDFIGLTFVQDDVQLRLVQITKFTPNMQKYYIADLGSGTAKDGTVYLAIDIIEVDSSAEIPRATHLGYSIKDDYVFEDFMVPWTTDKSAHYVVYDEKLQGFKQF